MTNVWVLSTGSNDDPNTQIHGVYMTKEMAYNEFVSHVQALQKSWMPDVTSMHNDDTEIYVEVGLDYVKIEAIPLHTQNEISN